LKCGTIITPPSLYSTYAQRDEFVPGQGWILVNQINHHSKWSSQIAAAGFNHQYKNGNIS
jgi:hypothetical protein